MENKVTPLHEISNSCSTTVPVVNEGYVGDCRDENQNENGVVTLPSAGEDDTLQRTLGYRQGFVLMVGLILGSGVFISPKLVAQVKERFCNTFSFFTKIE